MTRWILQAKADEPWVMFHTLSGKNDSQTLEPEMEELDDSWIMRPQTGSFQSGRISKL
jgi:hypothetical protein